jgi:hypothetical protein
VVALAAFIVLRNTEAVASAEREAVIEFERVRAQFAPRPPLVEIVDLSRGAMCSCRVVIARQHPATMDTNRLTPTIQTSAHGRRRQFLGYVGAALLLLIIPVKLFRYWSTTGQMLVGVAPSLLGPSGLLFLVLSSPGRLSKLTLVPLAIWIGAICVGLELAQLLPRPGILARVRYTFDVLDVLATVLSVSVSAAIAGLVLARGGNRK